MKSRVSSVLPKTNFYDGQKVTESDLDAEQLHNQSVSSGIINDFHGSGIVKDSLFESNILLKTSEPGVYSKEGKPNLTKETIELGRYDGLPIKLDLQPSDSYGNRLELELVNADIGGRIETKVLIVGFCFSSLSTRGQLVSEIVSFQKNGALLSKYYYTEVLSVIFNNFSGGLGKTEYEESKYSLNVISSNSGYLEIRESEPLKVFPKAIVAEQTESPNWGLNSFITSDLGTSIESLLMESIGDDVNFSDLYFELSPALVVSFEKNGSVTKSFGQKFLSNSNNIQRVDFLLSVTADTSLPAEEQFDFSGEFVLSINRLQTETKCATDLVPDRLIDFDPEIEPLIEISFSQEDLSTLGYSLNDTTQPVSFNFASTLLADPNISPGIIKGEYYSVIISRRGDTRTGTINLQVGWDKPTRKNENGQILTPEERFQKQSSRFFEFDTSTKRYVDYSSYSLWHRIHADCVEITPGTAYSDDSFSINIPKVQKFVGNTEISRYIDGISLSDVSFNGSNYVVLNHIQDFQSPTTHPRTGNLAYTRILDTGEVSVYNESEFNNITSSNPLVLAKVSDKNVRNASKITQQVSLPGTVDRDFLIIIEPSSSLLTDNLIGRLLTPDVACECNKKYNIIKTECLNYSVGDLNNDGTIDSLDILEFLNVIGNTINSVATEREILSGNLEIIKFKQSDLNGDSSVDGIDLEILEDAIDGYVNFSVPETFRVLKIYVQNIFESSNYPVIINDPLISASTTADSNEVTFTVSDYRTALAIRAGDVVSLSGLSDSGLFLVLTKELDSSGINVTLTLTNEDQTIPSFTGESSIPISVNSGTATNLFADNLNLLKLPFVTSSIAIDFCEFPFTESNIEVCDLRRYVSRNFIEEKIKNPCIYTDDSCGAKKDCSPSYRNQQYISGDVYIPDGEIYSAPGIPYHGDFEYVNISVSLPPGSLDDCQIDLYNSFVKAEVSSTKTAAGYPGLVYSDGTFVGCEDTSSMNDIQRGRVKFSSAIASLYVDSLIIGPVTDGYAPSPTESVSSTSSKNIVTENFIDQTASEFYDWAIDPITDSVIFTPTFIQNLEVSFSTLYVSGSGNERYGLFYRTTFNDLTGDLLIDFTMARYIWPTTNTNGGVYSAIKLDITNDDLTTAELKFGWKQYSVDTVKLFWSGIIRDSGGVIISSFESSIDAPDSLGEDLLFRIKRTNDTFFAYYITPNSISETVDFGQFIRIGSNPSMQPGSGSVKISFECKQEIMTQAGLSYNVILKELTARSIYSSELSSSDTFVLSKDILTNEISRVAVSVPIEITPRTNIISASLTFTSQSEIFATDSFNIIPLQINNADNLVQGYNYPYIQDVSFITNFMPGALPIGSTFSVDITSIIIKYLSDPGFLPGYFKAFVIEPDSDVSVNSKLILSSSIKMDITYQDITTGVIFKIGVNLDPATGIASFKTKNVLYDSLNSENRTTINFGVYLKKSAFKNKDIKLGITELKKIGLGSCSDPNLVVSEGEQCYFVVSSTGVGTFVQGPFDCAFNLP